MQPELGRKMGDNTMPPPPRGPANPRQKFAVKPGFSMLVNRVDVDVMSQAHNAHNTQNSYTSCIEYCRALNHKPQATAHADRGLQPIRTVFLLLLVPVLD